jgi:hypothetical protein
MTPGASHIGKGEFITLAHHTLEQQSDQKRKEKKKSKDFKAKLQWSVYVDE